jgi:16S rRNA C1402 (ribose-2'-O) methylase RsmI
MINLFSKDFCLTKRRQTRYLALAEETNMILYVSPHKLVKTLWSFNYFGEDRQFVFVENYQTVEENVRGTERSRCSF